MKDEQQKQQQADDKMAKASMDDKSKGAKQDKPSSKKDANNKRGGKNRGNNPGKPNKEEGHNDPSWYCVDEAIGKDVASIPYNVFAGSPVINRTPPAGGVSLVAQLPTIPGVAVIKYLPVPGLSISGSSAINVASRAIYSWVRHANSGHANYEHADLMIYILAMDQIYTLLLELRRIYDIAMTYSAVNRYVGDGLLQALGCMPATVRSNLAQIRYYYNLMVAKIQALCIPNVLDYFKRHALLASTVLGDSDSVRGQFYLYQCSDVFKFEPYENQTGGSLKCGGRGITWGNITTAINTINHMIDNLVSNEDINIMSGDILKAYGEENLYRLTKLPEDETIEIIYDEGMLNAIENLTIINNANLQGHLEIAQTNGALIYGPKFVGETLSEGLQSFDSASNLYTFGVNDIYINSHKEQPDWKDNLEFTPTTSCLIKLDDTANYFLSCGSELIVKLRLCYFEEDHTMSFTDITSSCLSDAVGMARIISVLNYFDWHPIMYLYEVESSLPNAYKYVAPIFDAKTFTRISPETVHRFKESMLMGLFKTQLITKTSTKIIMKGKK